MAQPEPEGTGPKPSLATSLANRHGAVSLACVLALAALAWWWLTRSAPTAMGGSAAGPGMPEMAMASARAPWSAADVAAAVTMWAVMMAAMMLPSAAPMIALHRVFAVKRGLGSAGTLAFAAGYAVLWLAFALGAALLQTGLVQLGWIEQAELSLGWGQSTAALLAAAGLYQLSPLKQRCLIACQSPFVFLVAHWRAGTMGAFSMGLRHALFCIGCCWALMLLLFVGGVMNLAWIAALTALVIAEKYADPAWRLDRILALLLFAAAALLALQP